jgi:hypothetical protein
MIGPTGSVARNLPKVYIWRNSLPRVEVLVKTKDGQSILLTEGDRIEKTVIIECNSQRCASRHGQEKPQEVSLVDGQPMPEAARQWLSLILPETSPQYTPMPPNFCSPSCVRDFLVYDYIAPSSAGVAPKSEAVQKMDSLGPEPTIDDPLGLRAETTPGEQYSPVSQADGDSGEGENPQGPKFL